MTDSRPVGVFDSGVGGLTVLRAIHDRLPNESTIYVGDLAYFPYGPKPRGEVQERALAIAMQLVRGDVKALVIACNTATSAALPDVEAALDIPVVGVVRPGAVAAIERSASKVIGVVATEGTVGSRAYSDAIRDICPDAQVHQVAAGELVDLVEAGAMRSQDLRVRVRSAVETLVHGRGCDTIILGCTHFPLIREVFEEAAGDGADVVDSAFATAEALESVLDRSDLEAPVHARAEHRFLVTAHATAFVDQARILFGEHVDARRIDVEVATESRPRGVAVAE